jgi:AraC-like DNA-binding protein
MTAKAGDSIRFCFSRIPMQAGSFPRDVARHLRPFGVLQRTLSPLSRDPGHADVTVHVIGRTCRDSGVCLVHMAVTTGVAAERGAKHLRDGSDDVVLFIDRGGRSIVSQRGQEAVIKPGGGLLISNAAASTVLHPGAARFVAIGVPRRPTMALVARLEDLLMRQLPRDAGVLQILVRYLSILEDDDALGASELQNAVATHIHDLCVLALGATRDAAEIARGRGLRAARLSAIRADIARNLEHGEVSAPALAMRHRVTSRYIHKLFESEGVTLSRFVLGRRLARVHRMLIDPVNQARTISDVAFRAGFGDLSTFNREFRRHYGATPSDVRAAARRESGQVLAARGKPLGPKRH